MHQRVWFGYQEVLLEVIFRRDGLLKREPALDVERVQVKGAIWLINLLDEENTAEVPIVGKSV